jgi:stage II sporulation protein D
MTPLRQRLPAAGSMILALALACIALSCSSAPTSRTTTRSGPSVRVCIADFAGTTTVQMQEGAVIETPRGAHVMSSATRLTCALRDDGAMTVRAGEKELGPIEGVFRCYHRGSAATFDINGRLYPDTLVFASDGTRLFIVNILPVERYLESVVPNEIGRNRKDNEYEAIKAQAIIARTYTMMKIDLPLRRLFDVYADTRDQVYTGMLTRTELATRAIRETRGQVLTFEGNYAECYFHSTCGGATEAVSLVWKRPQSKPYLKGVRDRSGEGDFCRISPSFRWSELYTRRDLEALLRTYLPSADDTIKASDFEGGAWTLVDLRILARMPSGRVQKLKIVMSSGNRTRTFLIEGDRIRWALRRTDASSVLRSAMFDLIIDRDASRAIRTVRIDGGGNGHGIGLCQWGAIARARMGIKAGAILRAYFPSTSLALAW